MKTKTTTAKEPFIQLQNLLKTSLGREFSNYEIREALQQSLDLVKTLEPSPEHDLLKKTLYKTVNDLYRLSLVNTVDFFKDYFENLPEFESREECFDNLNEAYKDAFGEYKYENFKAFKKALGME